MIYIFFIYGLAFFLLGMALFLYPKKDSRYELSKHILLIACFAVLHGIHEWIEMFILIYKPMEITVLNIFDDFNLPVSFSCLLIFGIKSIFSNRKVYPALKLLPVSLFAVWIMIVATNGHGNIWARYLIGVPGIFLTAYALLLQSFKFKKETSIPKIFVNLRWAAGAFFLYGIFSGLIVKEADFFPASVINSTVFLKTFGVPVQVFRAVCAAVIAFNLTSVLKLFDHEIKEELRASKNQLEKTNTYLSLMIESLPVALYTRKAEGDSEITYISNDIQSVTGYKPEDYMSKPSFWIENVHPEDQEMVSEGLSRIVVRGHMESEYRWRISDGTYKWFYDMSKLVKLPTGEISHIIGNVIDITKRKRDEEMLRISQQEWEDTFNYITDMITIHDRDFNIIKANKAAGNILDLPFLKNSKFKCYKYYHGTSSAPEGCPSCDCLNTGKPAVFETFEPHLNRHIEIRAIPRFDVDNQINGLIHVVRDISKRKEMEDRLKAMSMTDELTGLYNRRGFFTLMAQHIKLIKRRKEKVFLLYADIDYFKEINDICGHNEGDIILIDVADILRATYRESDIIARLGGDEFVVFPIADEEAHINAITARLQKNIDTFNDQNEHNFKLSMSVGVTPCDPEDYQSIDELIATADKLMYEQKRQRHQAAEKIKNDHPVLRDGPHERTSEPEATDS